MRTGAIFTTDLDYFADISVALRDAGITASMLSEKIHDGCREYVFDYTGGCEAFDLTKSLDSQGVKYFRVTSAYD